MSDQEPTTKIGAKLEATLNLGNYNNARLTLWIDDRVRPIDNSASAGIDRLVNLLNSKLEAWAKEFTSD